ncbi:MAG: hypothetical protein K1X79_05530 [Oligoflexia bacterium]|nr:hypothetical protein [Oligoflexia bacterium]
MDAEVARTQNPNSGSTEATQSSPVAIRPEELTPESFHAHVNRAAEQQALAALREASTDPSIVVTATTNEGVSVNGRGLDIHAKGEVNATRAAEMAASKGYTSDTVARLMAVARHGSVAERNTSQFTATTRATEDAEKSPVSAKATDGSTKPEPGSKTSSPAPSASDERTSRPSALIANPATPESLYVPADQDGMVSIPATPKALSESDSVPRFDYRPSGAIAETQKPGATLATVAVPKAEVISSIPALAQATTSTAQPEELMGGPQRTTEPVFRVARDADPGLSRSGKGRYFVVPSASLAA